MARICIVTPGQLGSNPRVVKEASTLAEAGHEVTVVCTKVAEFVEPRDQAVIAKARFSVHRISFDQPLLWYPARIRQAAAKLPCRLGMIPIFAEGALSAMTQAISIRACAQPADLYIAHYTAALPAAARAAKRNGALFAYDAEDFHLGDLPEAPEHTLEKKLIRAIEGRYLPAASYVTAASPLIAQAYATTYGIGLPSTILNVFPKTNAPVGPTPCGTAQPGPSIYWFSQTIGPGRGLETALEAIARASGKIHLYLRGTPAPGYEKRLRDLAKQAGVADRLHVLEPAVPDELERLGAAFDLGYVGEIPETLNRKIALTNKLFSYLLGGVPTLASDIPAHRAIAGDLGPALNLFAINDAQSLAAAMDALLLNPERLAAARAHAWRLSQERLNWDLEKAKLIGAVNQALNRHGVV